MVGKFQSIYPIGLFGLHLAYELGRSASGLGLAIAREMGTGGKAVDEFATRQSAAARVTQDESANMVEPGLDGCP